MNPVLFIFSGLPGVGKTTIARALAQHYKAAYLRIDTIEHALRELCEVNVQGEGYRLAYRIAADNLLAGNLVVADCCNPWELTRSEWEGVALSTKSSFVNIEIVCSDSTEHQHRVENRVNDINGFTLPSWQEVKKRDYQEWNRARIVIETAGRTVDACLHELIKATESRK